MTTLQTTLVRAIETRIMHAAIRELLAHGFSLGVFDGEEHTVKNSTDPAQVFAALRTTDDDYLYVYDHGVRVGWIRFVYGNDGWDVIADNTTSLEKHLTQTTALAESLQ